MAVDGIFLHFIKKEISAFAVGAKVDKIYMPSRAELVFVLRSRQGSRRLFISVSGNSPRINFTSSNPENPQNPPMLCMFFRKQLSGAILRDIRQEGLDRILYLDFDAVNEIGDLVKRTLVIEIMAQYSNCILVNEENVILDAIKRVDSTKSSYREVLPLLIYKLPPQQDKINLLSDPPSAALESVLSAPEKLLSASILSHVSGVSPLIAKEIAYRISLGDVLIKELGESQKERLLFEFSALAEMIRDGSGRPTYLKDNTGNLLDFSYMPLTFYANAADIVLCDSLSEILDLFYVEREKYLRAKAKAEDLFRLVNNMIERTSKKIDLQRNELLSGEEMEQKRKFAELISANIYSLPKGVDHYDVDDYYNNYQPVRIPALPELSPAANSQKYYKEYRKAQTAKKILTEQIEKGAADLEYLRSVQDALSRTESQGEISELRAELSLAGFLKSKTGIKNKKNSSIPPFEFTAPSGAVVYVGRNNLQNDALTFKKAGKSDWWFHVKKAPGSHVVLCTQNREASDEDMEFAARTAAWFSSVRDRGMAEVDYTQIKNIKKPPASKPGFVIYHVYNTAYVKAENPLK